MINAKLVVVGGTAESELIELQHLPTVFGRGRDATISLPHPLVSRQHCEIFEANGRLMVRDLGSTNGTFVGSERIVESVLAPGDLLTIGTVTFRAMYGGISEVDPRDAFASASDCTLDDTEAAVPDERSGQPEVKRDTSNVASDSSLTRTDVAHPLRQTPSGMIQPASEETCR